MGNTTVDESKRKLIERYNAGATVRHAGPYAELEVPVNMDHLDDESIAKWVLPFYMANLITKQQEFEAAFNAVRESIDDSLITSLLTYFNWRPRIVGAYFTAITVAEQHCDHIGRLLLRSDLCCAGTGYALALARINTDLGHAYLCKYLDHYLEQPDLYFDQNDVMAALSHLDTINGTNVMHSYIDRWDRFVANKPNWDLDYSIDRFGQQLDAIERIATSGI